MATCSLWNLCLIYVEKLLCAGVEKCYVTVSQYPIRATEIGAFVSRQLQRDFFNCHIVYCEPRQLPLDSDERYNIKVHITIIIIIIITIILQ